MFDISGLAPGSETADARERGSAANARKAGRLGGPQKHPPLFLCAQGALSTLRVTHCRLINPRYASQAARGRKSATSSAGVAAADAAAPAQSEAAKQPTAVYTPTGEMVSILKVHHDRDPVCFTVVMPNGETRQATRESLKPCRPQKEKNRKSRVSDPTKQKARRASQSKKAKENSCKGDGYLLKKALRHQHEEEAPKKAAPAAPSEVVAARMETAPRDGDPPFVRAFLKEVDEAREAVHNTGPSQHEAVERRGQSSLEMQGIEKADEDSTTQALQPNAALVQLIVLPEGKGGLEERITSAPGTPVQSIQGLLRGHQVFLGARSQNWL